MIYDLAIIGGGSSGCLLALSYLKKNRNKKCIILESNDSLLKKLQATGNGKCNFTNDLLDYKVYENGESIKGLLNDGKNKILSYFDYLGIKYYKDSEGRYYPLSNSAKSVKFLIENKLKELKTDIKTQFKVTEIDKLDNIFTISNGIEKVKANNLAIATGNKNYPKLGSDGSLFKEIEKLGIGFTEIYPSDIYINVKEKDITKSLSGERFKAELTLFNSGKDIYKETGELLFKDDALSGIVTFNLSSRLAHLYKEGIIDNPIVRVDFLPSIDTIELKELLSNPKDIESALYGIFNPKLVKVLIGSKKRSIIENIKGYEFSVKSLGDFENAQVACGGIRIDEIGSNFESNKIKGLYFIGDILDISAPCGGYNLSFAFLSAIKVGESL